MSEDRAPGGRVWQLRWPMAVAFVAAAILPLCFTPIPPMIDLPGHMGRFAVQTAAPDSPVWQYFGFHWRFTLNLGTDLLVELIAPVIGLVAAVWLIVAASVALTALGLVLVARVLNPRGAAGLGWAMIFVHGFAFHFGFLNYLLGAALSLIGFALWVALDARRPLRSALFLAIAPILLVVHAVGGGLLIAMVGGYELWRHWRAGPGWSAVRETARTLAPFASVLIPVALWLAAGDASGASTRWVLPRKLDGLTMVVRDQNILLDIGTALAALGVAAYGWWRGARMWAPGAVLAAFALYLAAPSVLSSVAHIDERIVPVVAMLALALQDWSAMPAKVQRAVLLSGLALLGVRVAVTTAAFAGYSASYARELAALDVVRPGARVLALTGADCDYSGWRRPRLDHLSNLATVYRQAWVNSHWAKGGIQLLDVRYRPSPIYFADPSQFVYPARCVALAKPFDARPRHMIGETLARLPLGGADYLWLIGTGLPPGYHDPRLQPLWSNGGSTLYAIRAQAVSIPPPSP